MDNRGSNVSSVDTGANNQLYDGRIHSHPAGDRHCRCVSQHHLRATGSIMRLKRRNVMKITLFWYYLGCLLCKAV